MLFGYGGGHGGDACLDVNQLGIAVFPGKGWRTNGGAKEVETNSEFGGDWRAEGINVVCFGRVPGDGVGD